MNSVLAEPLGASAIERDRARPRVTDLCIVLRGELFSDTGVARHCRALASLLRPHAKKFGAVSLYAHPSRMRNRVPFPVITDGEIEEFAAGDRLVVINFCSPPDFRRVERAYNVGYFPWETNVFPPREAWLGHMKLMERIWAPSTWQSALVQSLAGLAEAPVIPWPQEAVEHRVEPGAPRLAKITAQRPMTAAQLRNFSLRASPPGARRTEILSEERAFQSGVNERFDPGAGPKLADLLNERRGDAFLAMQTDVPRKGLPLLLSAWMSFKATEEGRDAILVIKHSSIDVAIDLYRMHFHNSLAILRAAGRFGLEDPGVWFVYGSLSELQLRDLFASSDAFVSATLGEGFGGPIAESLLLAVPVIAPAHTSVRDLLGDDYPLTVASAAHPLALWNNIPVYSDVAAWHIPDEHSFVARLQQFAGMSAAKRRATALRAQEGLLERTGYARSRKIVADEFAWIAGACAALDEAARDESATG